MTSPLLRVGLLGFGYASQTFHAPLIQAVSGLKITAVSSSDAAKVHKALGADITVYASAEELIASADVDLVVIATPNLTHHPLAGAALLAGRHVVVDKPFTADTQQAEELIALAREQQRVLSVFHNRRWDSTTLTVKKLLKAGALGPIRHARMHFDRYRPQPRVRWREAEGQGGGLWMDLGPHLLDEALGYFGWPEAIHLDLATLRPGAQIDDHFQATLRYADGLRVTLHASCVSALPGPRIELHGLRGSFVKWGMDRQEDALKAGVRPDVDDPSAWGADPDCGELAVAEGDAGATLLRRKVPTENGAYPAYYQQLCECLLGQRANPVPAEEALDVMRLLDLGNLSASTGREMPARRERTQS
ncbi:MAG TPA: oxidoreductase [Burkholderiaceae bacterium]|jgi:predicted dehydrogenase